MSKVRLDRNHGSPYDRGSADSWYRRARRPHFFEAGSYTSAEFVEGEMTVEQINEYHRGYNDQEATGDHKEWK